MESSFAGIVNVWLCLAIVLGLFVYRRHGAAHKPMITWLAYWLMLGYIIIPFRWLSGTYTHSSWLVVALNLVFCALIVWAHGNLSKILSLLRHPHEIKR
ncbi:phage holin family protein [Escherichia coli]|uniref:phage holin family protein n=1 Tax=Escherichia coli TaxID=562 RepID=UPI000D701839|nr:phage holin family protein [Escherichia coli]MCQ5895290.1 phage holin family protein [Escherichia coli]MCQ5900951.1 phage holin family protein [Escherichia coli]MCQ5922676.1 phage holin family protein [Escherichia coli]MCQ5933056.1 phage holin family protein [Escherichia coli]MCQ5943395.1 phage holin family protein [Escherichia coli]